MSINIRRRFLSQVIRTEAVQCNGGDSVSLKLALLFFISCLVIMASVQQTISFQSLNTKQSLISQGERVHNLDTGLDYTNIQAAIDAVETLDGHTILVDAGVYYEHVVVNKSISLVGQDRSTTIIDGGGTGTVVNITKNNVNVTGFTIQDSGGFPEAGIYLDNANHCSISGNNIANNEWGIRFVGSSDNAITMNNVINNQFGGIYLVGSSNNTIIINDITNNGPDNQWGGIYLVDSSNNAITMNNITNNYCGIVLYGSSENTITMNNVSANNYGGIYLSVSLANAITMNDITSNHNYPGIWLSSSSNNIISGNNITANNYGIYFWHSSNNRLYHNNFVDNSAQHYVEGSFNNSWDDGVEGNYWSNYNGTDGDHDGIGDSWHEIDENNTDRYPLMGMFHSFNTSLGYYVNVISNSTVEDFDYFVSNNTIRMHVSNMTGNQTYGFCRVCIPKDLMVPPYNVTINDGAIEVLHFNDTIHDNGTHRWIYFAYQHSTHKIDIIPEFPSLIITPLFMTAALLAVIVCKRKQLFWSHERASPTNILFSLWNSKAVAYT